MNKLNILCLGSTIHQMCRSLCDFELLFSAVLSAHLFPSINIIGSFNKRKKMPWLVLDNSQTNSFLAPDNKSFFAIKPWQKKMISFPWLIRV